VAPRTVEKHTSVPGILRNGFGVRVDGPVEERWKLGSLIDTIHLRSLWLHRVEPERTQSVSAPGSGGTSTA
jgi:hypothetical protein